MAQRADLKLEIPFAGAAGRKLVSAGTSHVNLVKGWMQVFFHRREIILAPMPETNCPRLVLASTSPFRKMCLERIIDDFLTADPGVDETPMKNEQAEMLAMRLSVQKAEAVASKMPSHVVIAGDQVLEVGGKCYGKPGDIGTARKHLTELSGKSGCFFSGMCVIADGSSHQVMVPTEVSWVNMDDAMIDAYIRREPSIASAGAAQLEKLGISLVRKMSSEDPTAILGLPLIELCRILRGHGMSIP